MAGSFKEEIDLRLILSSVKALLGAVPSSLRSVSVELKGSIILFQCIFDTGATEDDFELLSAAATEVLADFKDLVVKELFEKVPFPEKMQHLDNLIYFRYENQF